MKYTKPLILNTNRATSVIQGIGKFDKTQVDGSHMPMTVPAYEADE